MNFDPSKILLFGKVSMTSNSTPFLLNVLGPVLLIFQYLEELEGNAILFSQSEVVLHFNLENLEEKDEECS